MRSKWFELKTEALILRRKGKSIKYVSTYLGIPLSTLSGWFKDIKLTKFQKKVLKIKWERALIKARKGAVKWHKSQKEQRLKFAEDQAEKTLLKISNTQETLELALALLYLGEGFKKSSDTGMGNTDPLILKFFLNILINVYRVKIDKISIYLHLRYDQNPDKMKLYWSNELNIPLDRFKKVSIDSRTKGRPTYPNYKGVCLINCGNVAIQRKLVYIGRKFCEQTVKNLCALSSAG